MFVCKMEIDGLRGVLFQWSLLWLQNRQQCVELNTVKMDICIVADGDPPDSIIGSLLFEKM